MAKRRKRRSTIRKSSKLGEPKTKKEERKKFPKELIETYLAVRNDWENDELYLKYKEESKKYLGDKWNDKLEDGRLIVLLHVATTDLHDVKKKKQKENQNKKLECVSSMVQKFCGSNENQEEKH